MYSRHVRQKDESRYHTKSPLKLEIHPEMYKATAIIRSNNDVDQYKSMAAYDRYRGVRSYSRGFEMIGVLQQYRFGIILEG